MVSTDATLALSWWLGWSSSLMKVRKRKTPKVSVFLDTLQNKLVHMRLLQMTDAKSKTQPQF